MISISCSCSCSCSTTSSMQPISPYQWCWWLRFLHIYNNHSPGIPRLLEYSTQFQNETWHSSYLNIVHLDSASHTSSAKFNNGTFLSAHRHGAIRCHLRKFTYLLQRCNQCASSNTARLHIRSLRSPDVGDLQYIWRWNGSRPLRPANRHSPDLVACTGIMLINESIGSFQSYR